MKLKAKKLTKNKPTNKVVKDYTGIQQLIFDNPKHINEFNTILEDYILSLQQSDKQVEKETKKCLDDIFLYFLIKNKKLISSDLLKFLEEKLELIMKIYLDLIEESLVTDQDECEGITKDFMDYIVNFILKETLRNDLIQKFLRIAILSTKDNEIVDPQIISSLVSQSLESEEVFHMIITNMVNVLKSDILGVKSVYNLYNFIIVIPKLSECSFDSLSTIKQLYQNIIITLINNANFPSSLLKNLLLNLNKNILENVENPLIFSDFLISIYEKSESDDFDIKILSLNGLFILITKYKLDYANYYNMLYQTLCLKIITDKGYETVFDSKYRSRLFRILSLSFKSTTVPIMVVFSVLKKLARICLISKENNIAVILGLIQNVIKTHPKTLILLMKKQSIKRRLKNTKDGKLTEASKFDWEKFHPNHKEEPEDKGQDEDKLDDQIDPKEYYSKHEQFRDDEYDPYKTKANMSALWELYTLQNHYSVKVRTHVNNLTKNFLTKDFDLNSISGLKLKDMLFEIKETNANFYVSRDDNGEVKSKLENII